MTGAIVLVVGVVFVVMWRRRAARRAAAAQERIAGVIAPPGPKGRYPKPGRGRNSIGPGRTELRAAVVCVLCGSGTGSPGDGLVLLSWCGQCRAERQILIGLDGGDL